MSAAILLLASGCASTDSPANPTTDGNVLPDGGAPPNDGRVPYPDRGTPTKIGSNCQPTETQVLYKNGDGRSGWMPRIAWSNGQYGVVWTQEASEGNTIKAYPAFVRVSPAGQPAGAPVQLSQLNSARNTEPAAIAGLGTSGKFAVAWADQGDSYETSDILLQAIDAQGRPEGTPAKITSSGAASWPYLERPAFVGVEGTLEVNELALAWRDTRDLEEPPYPGGPSMGRSDVYFKVITPDGSDKLAETRVTTEKSPTKPFAPVLSHDGEGYAVVWKDTNDISRTDLIFAALNGNGSLKGPEQLLVTNRGPLSSAPDLVAIGPEYGVGYSENPDANSGMIRFSRIDKAGSVMATQLVTNVGNPCTPAVAYNGERYALVWQSNCGQTGSQLVFAIIDDGGNPLKADGTSCYNSGDPSCGIVTISPNAKGTAAFPEMISVAGKFAVTWMNAPEDEILFSHITCTP